MKMLLMGMICLLIVNVGVGHSGRVDEVLEQFVADVITSFYGSSTFTAFLCENSDGAFEFSRYMSRSYNLHEIIELPADHYAFTPVDSILAHRNFYVIDFDCPGSYELLAEANRSEMFVAPTKWLILQDLRFKMSTNETTLASRFGDFHLFPDSEVIVGQRGNENVVSLLSIYRPSIVRDLIVEVRGTWDSANGIQLRDDNVSSRRRLDLQGTPLKASVVVTYPDTKNHLEDTEDKRVDVITKVGYTFSNLLMERMNAAVHFTFTPTWGYKDVNGTWTGMIGEIFHGDVDFGATGTFITASRLNTIHYIHLYSPNRVRFIFRRPPLSHISNLFTLPFSKTVWITILIFCILGFALLYLSMAWEWKKVKGIPINEKLSGDLEVKPAFGDNFLILIGAITQQGSSYEPRTVPARIVIFMVLILCLSLYAAYTANIVALLQSSSDSVKNVQDLTYGPLKIGIHDIVYNHYYFGLFEDAVRKDLYERRVRSQKNVWLTLEEGIDRVRHELFAFHTDRSLAYDVVQSTYGEDEKCGFEEIDYLYVPDPAFAIKYRSPYKEIFRVGARWLEETGLKERFIRIMYSKKPVCNDRKKFLSVGTTECYAAYLTIGYGVAITLGVLLLEILWSRHHPGAIGTTGEFENHEWSGSTSGIDGYVDEFNSALD